MATCLPYDAFMQPLLIILGIAAIIGLIYWSYIQTKKRREAFQAWAAAQDGWSYSQERRRDVYNQYRFLDKMRQGSNHYSFDHLSGTLSGYEARAFNFHYETHSTDSKGNRQTHHHHFGVILIHIEREFPELRLHPEGLLSKLGQMLGYDDIDFESIEFSKKFSVRSKDKKFAFDFFNTGMIEYLLKYPKIALEIEGDTLAIYDSNMLHAEELDAFFSQLLHIRKLMPDFLFRA